jgi:hypothetical protein
MWSPRTTEGQVGPVLVAMVAIAILVGVYVAMV